MSSLPLKHLKLFSFFSHTRSHLKCALAELPRLALNALPMQALKTIPAERRPRIPAETGCAPAVRTSAPAPAAEAVDSRSRRFIRMAYPAGPTVLSGPEA